MASTLEIGLSHPTFSHIPVRTSPSHDFTPQHLTYSDRISHHLCQVQRRLGSEDHDTPRPCYLHRVLNSVRCCELNGRTVNASPRIPSSIVLLHANTTLNRIILHAFQGMGASGIYSMVLVIAPTLVPTRKVWQIHGHSLVRFRHSKRSGANPGLCHYHPFHVAMGVLVEVSRDSPPDSRM